MNKQMKQHLESVIDSIVEGNTVAAKESFHSYLRAKTQSILLGEADAAEDEEDDDGKKKKSDVKVDKDLDKVSKFVKKTKKDQKKDEDEDC